MFSPSNIAATREKREGRMKERMKSLSRVQ